MNKIFIAIAMLLFLFSCKKSDEVDDLNPPLSSRLVKVFALDTTLTVPHDTIGVTDYFYDNQERPSMYKTLQRSNTGDTLYYAIFKYEYNGNETFASRTIDDQTDNYGGTHSHYFDTTVYSFSNGKCVYDSSFSYNNGNRSYYATRYTYEPGIVRMISKSYYTGNPVGTDTEVAYQTLSSGNIIHQLDSSRNVIGGSVLNVRFENTATYMPNPNPFAVFSNPIRRPYLHDDIGIGSVRAAPEKLFSAHSIVEDTWGSSSNHYQWSTQYNYVFRADGYPVQAKQVSPNGPIYKFIFVYE